MIKQSSYKYEDSIIVDRPIPKKATTEALESLSATLNFINFWIKRFDITYKVVCGMYNKAMKNMLQKITKIKSKPLSQGKKHKKLLTEIGGGWYMEKLLRDYHHLGYQN